MFEQTWHFPRILSFKDHISEWLQGQIRPAFRSGDLAAAPGKIDQHRNAVILARAAEGQQGARGFWQNLDWTTGNTVPEGEMSMLE